jgi:hypothetical protein
MMMMIMIMIISLLQANASGKEQAATASAVRTCALTRPPIFIAQQPPPSAIARQLLG